MKRNGLVLFIMMLFVAIACPIAHAGPAAELAEWLLKQGSRYADDVAGKGAKELAVELEELSVRAGDDAVALLVKNGGPGALKAVRGLGDRAPDAVRLIARHGESGKLLVQQGRSLTVDVFREFGDDGVRVLTEQGASTGGKMLSVYGKALAESRLSPESAAHLRHWLPEIEKAEQPLRHSFVDKLRSGGDDFVVWVHKRWKEVAVAGGLSVAAISAYKVGDGIAAAIPDPAKNPLGWFSWWMPFIAVVGILAGAWVLRHALSAWIVSRRAAVCSTTPSAPAIPERETRPGG
ncbi:MAG TPA: hypothetical protein PKE29_13020 [Phycisphaerales bacterium]|nr:hypothetical protein [Phycisphaerales bacterium]